MAPTFFLSRFGISTVQANDNYSGDTKLENEPEKKIEKPKISPYHFEIVAATQQEVIGTQLYAKINGDTDDDESAWVFVYKDNDGDLAIDITIDKDSWIDNAMYFEFDGNLKTIPPAARKVNDDGKFIINVDGFVKLNSKLSALLTKVEKPDNVGNEWYEGKYHSNGKGRLTMLHQSKWIPVLMPIDDSFVEGIYAFV